MSARALLGGITLSLGPIASDGDDLLKVEPGAFDPVIVEVAEESRFDQLPVCSSGRFLGTVDVCHLRELVETGTPLSKDDPRIYASVVKPTVALEELLLKVGEFKSVGFEFESGGFGLVTVADLNRHYFRGHLYPIVAELEAELADFIETRFAHHSEWLTLLPPVQANELNERWEEDKAQGIETSPITGCMLPQLLLVIAKSPLLLASLGFQSRKKFEGFTGRFTDLRNRIMHPVRPLLRSESDALSLLATLTNIVDFNLRIDSSYRPTFMGHQL